MLSLLPYILFFLFIVVIGFLVYKFFQNFMGGILNVLKCPKECDGSDPLQKQYCSTTDKKCYDKAQWGEECNSLLPETSCSPIDKSGNPQKLWCTLGSRAKSLCLKCDPAGKNCVLPLGASGCSIVAPCDQSTSYCSMDAVCTAKLDPGESCLLGKYQCRDDPKAPTDPKDPNGPGRDHCMGSSVCGQWDPILKSYAVPDGNSCLGFATCGANSTCGDIPLVCKPLHKEGESCSAGLSQCEKGLVCQGVKCVQKGKGGEYCNGIWAGGECKSGECTINSRCAPTATEGKNAGETCYWSEECKKQNGKYACGWIAGDKNLKCCASGNSIYNSLDASWYCDKLPDGTACTWDGVCASGHCISGKCSQKNPAGGACYNHTDCISGACGWIDGDSDRKCCASSSQNYNLSQYCNNLPDGTRCITNAMCGNGSCVNGVCSSKKNEFDNCSSNSECKSNACAFKTNAGYAANQAQCCKGDATNPGSYSLSGLYNWCNETW